MAIAALQSPIERDGVDIAKPSHSKAVMTALSRVAIDTGRSYLAILSEIARLWFGAGRVSLDEYLDLRLYDNEIYKPGSKSEFVGLRAARKIWFQANYRVDLFAMARNKIASAIWFAAHGLPILPTLAIFHEGVGRPNARLLRNDVELSAFLRKQDHYPLFGKPIEGCQSIGSASIEYYDPTRDCLLTTTGRIISLDNFVSYVKSHGKAGYQFQARARPHTMAREICGERLATVRLLTIVRNGTPELLRACWKIPAGTHVADNFWRPGNLLAQLDMENGRVIRVIRATDTGYEEITHHPDTGTCIQGAIVPNWRDVKQLAMDGAKLLEDLPLVGWDIAPADSGAILVEPNVTPDFRLHQLADRRGMLDASLRSFLQQRKGEAANVVRAGKRTIVESRMAFLKHLCRDITMTLCSQSVSAWTLGRRRTEGNS